MTTLQIIIISLFSVSLILALVFVVLADAVEFNMDGSHEKKAKRFNNLGWICTIIAALSIVALILSAVANK